jgi:hypothetical protein
MPAGKMSVQGVEGRGFGTGASEETLARQRESMAEVAGTSPGPCPRRKRTKATLACKRPSAGYCRQKCHGSRTCKRTQPPYPLHPPPSTHPKTRFDLGDSEAPHSRYTHLAVHRQGRDAIEHKILQAQQQLHRRWVRTTQPLDAS